MAQSNNISIFVSSQVPDFWNRDAGELVNFIKLYYEWAEQFENPIVISRKLIEYKDVDLIPEKYLQFMRNEFMKNIPVTRVDDRLLMKNIVDFYRARGTEKAYKMLFRILYGDENVSFYYPGKDILRASDGKWVIERSLKLRLDSAFNGIEEIIVVRGETSDATARKDKFLSYIVNEVKTDELFINNVFGEFRQGENLFDDNTGQKIGSIDTIVTYPGAWIGTDGFLSSDKKLEDNFFYQEYSYQIRSAHALAEYESIANALVHPAGTKLFGAVEMFATADFSDLTLQLISNLGNVGDISRITIPYEVILEETPNFGAVNNIVSRRWITGAGVQDTQTGELLSMWLDYAPFNGSFAEYAFTNLSDYIILHSNVPSFTMTAWTPFQLIDITNSDTTYHYPAVVVNTSIIVLSKPYEYGLTTNLHYKIIGANNFAVNLEANDTISSTAKALLKANLANTEAVDTVSSTTKILLKANFTKTEDSDTLSSTSHTP